MKKLFILFAAALFCASVNAQATSGNCGTAGHESEVTWAFEGTTLTISGTGAMADYSYKETPWKDYIPGIQYVEIESGVTSVGNNAFSACVELESVTFPSEEFTRIGEYAFSECQGVESLNLPKSLTTLETGAFCATGIKSIKIPKGVKTIGSYAFESCYFLESIGIFEGVETIGDHAFDDCGLHTVVIPNSVTTIGEQAFFSNNALESVFIGSGITEIGEAAFLACEALKEVGCVAAAKPTLGDAVFTKDGMTPLDIEAFYVLDADAYAGWGDYAADKFFTVYNGSWVYADPFTSVDDPSKGEGTWSFDVPTGTLTINGTGIVNQAPWNDVTAVNPVVYADEEHLGFWGFVKKCVIGEGITSLEAMVCGMQLNCAEVTLPSTIKNISHSALEECAFTTISLPEGLETIDMYAFFGSKLTEVIIPSTVTKLGFSAFAYSEDLAKVTMLPTTPPALEDAELPFNGCDALAAIYVPQEQVSDYKTAWSAYETKIQANTSTAIDEINSSNTQTLKLIKHGNLYILRNGEVYNAAGARVE